MSQRTLDGPQGRLLVDADLPGDGAPILFVHSDLGDHSHWDGVRARLNGRQPTAAFDRRGHGASEPPRDGSFDHRQAASDIGAVADALGWDRFVLVGHSGGALDAFCFANLHPDRIQGLLLLDPPGDPSYLPEGMMQKHLAALRGENWREIVEEYYRGIAGDDPAVVEKVLEGARRAGQATVAGTTAAAMTFDPQPLLGRYEGPALSIIQQQFNLEGALHRLPPGFPYETVDGAGHWIHLAAPDRFFEMFEEFLDWVQKTRNPPAGALVSPEHATPQHPS